MTVVLKLLVLETPLNKCYDVNWFPICTVTHLCTRCIPTLWKVVCNSYDNGEFLIITPNKHQLKKYQLYCICHCILDSSSPGYFHFNVETNACQNECRLSESCYPSKICSVTAHLINNTVIALFSAAVLIKLFYFWTRRSLKKGSQNTNNTTLFIQNPINWKRIFIRRKTQWIKKGTLTFWSL